MIENPSPRAVNFDRLPGSGPALQRARFYLLCALAALVAVSGALLFGARYWRATAEGLKDLLPANVDMKFGRLTLSETGENGRSMVIEAVSALYNQARDSFVLDAVRARVGQGPGIYDITSETGRYDQGAKVITLTGRVKVTDDNGGVLSADSLTLKFAEGLLISDRNFCYATPEADLEGSAFVYRTHDRFLTVEGRAHLLF